MALMMVKNWWVLVLRGIVSLVFGVILFAYPSMTLLLLVTIFSIYALIEGGTRLAGAFANPGNRGNRWGLVISGAVGVLFGIFTLLFPSITAVWLIFLIAAHAILNGIFEIVIAIQLRREVEGEWVLVISGLLSVAFGVLIALRPAMGIVTVALVIGIYAVLLGISLIVLGVRLRGVARKIEKLQDAAPA